MMDPHKINKQLKEIEEAIRHISDHQHQVIIIRKAIEEIRKQLPKPPSSGEPFAWHAV